MILDPRLLSIIVFAFHKVLPKPLPQDADSESISIYKNAYKQLKKIFWLLSCLCQNWDQASCYIVKSALYEQKQSCVKRSRWFVVDHFCAFSKYPLSPGLLNILEIPLNIAGSFLKATNDTTPLLIEVSEICLIFIFGAILANLYICLSILEPWHCPVNSAPCHNLCRGSLRRAEGTKPKGESKL